MLVCWDRSIAYAACLEGSDPVRLFEKRMNMRRGNALSSQDDQSAGLIL